MLAHKLNLKGSETLYSQVRPHIDGILHPTEYIKSVPDPECFGMTSLEKGSPK